MSEFDIIAEPNLSASGGNNYLHANAAIQAALRMTHKVLAKAVTAGANTVTETELKEHGTIRCTGTPGGAVTLTLDNLIDSTDQDRRVIVQNALSDTSVITVDTVTGSATTPAINQDEVWLIAIDADEIVVAVNLTSGGGGSVSIDDDGSEVIATASTIDFVGAGVTASDGGSGTATISIPGLGGGIGGAWEAIEVASPSGANEVDFVLPDGYLDYQVRGVFSVGTNNAEVNFRVSTDGGSTFVSTTDYESVGMIAGSAGEAHEGASGADHILLFTNVGSAAGEYGSMLLDIRHPGNTSFRTAISQNGSLYRGTDSAFLLQETRGDYQATTKVDAIRVYPSAGTITGNFVLFGLKSDLPDASAKTVTEIDVSAGGTITLTDAQVRGADAFKATGSPAGAVTIDHPDGDRRYLWWNASGQTLTIDTVTGSTTKPTVANNERWQFQQDGVEIVAKHQWSAP